MEFQKAIDAAIMQEESSYKLYSRGAKLRTFISAKRLLKRLAEEELKHKKLLSGINLKTFAISKSTFTSMHLEEELMLTPTNELNEVKDIFELAIRKEMQAHKQYAAMARVIPFGRMKTFFENLSHEEAKHKKLVTIEYKKLL